MGLEFCKNDLRIKIFNEVLNRISLNSVLQVDRTMLDHFLNSYFDRLKKLFEYQIEEIDGDSFHYYFLLTEEAILLLRALSQSFSILDIFLFYRIYNKEKTDVFLRVIDIVSYEISGKLNIEGSLIKEWNSMQGQGSYFGISDEIPYTKDFFG